MKQVLVVLLLLTLVPVDANPTVPYCQGSVIGTDDARVILPEVCEATTGRVFPEASAASTPPGQLPVQDFVSFYEFEAGIGYLNETYPNNMIIREVAQSAGLPDVTGALHSLPIYIVEVTNYDSPVPLEERQQLFFMLSIHGNEKGGREGGFRVIEDFVRDIGMSQDAVQNGAGMPQPMPKPTGGEVSTYADYLDFTRLIFIFPNADGWAHDEAEFASTPCANYYPTLFCRTNGNGVDLNRQSPTLGWQNSGRNVVGEPESQFYADILQYDIDYAIDIHGMLNHNNFVAIMMPAGSLSPQEMLRSTRIAEDLKDRLNNDPHFDGWTQAWQSEKTAEATANGATCDLVDFCNTPSASSRELGSEQFAEWSTVWDAIGYTDSGFNGDFFAQDTGLNAPGYDVELAYNHVTVDSQYQAGAVFNDYHVQSVRQIVKTFMDAAALDVKVRYETNGSRTMYIASDYVATNADDVDVDGNPMLGPGGWASNNPQDDVWEYGEDQIFEARPAAYFEDMVPFVVDEGAAGVLTAASVAELTLSKLTAHDTLVIPGSAIHQFYTGTPLANGLPYLEAGEDILPAEPKQAKVDLVKQWVEDGGNLILTDGGMAFLDLAGWTDSVAVEKRYAGAMNFDRSHALLDQVRGAVRQTYEPVPMGFQIGNGVNGHAPIWGVSADQVTALGGSVAGTMFGGNAASLGEFPVGNGNVQFMGALLPDPTEEFYHPYGLDSYATTYSGNQIMRNMLGWSEVFAAPTVTLTEDGTIVDSPNEPVVASPDEGKDSPALPIALVLAALVFLVRRRK